MLKEGDKLPSFTLTDQNGEKKKLKDLTGENGLVLYVYPKDDTPGCTIEAKGFTALAEKFNQAGVRVVGVSRDDAKSHKKFCDKYSLAVTLLSDPDGRFLEKLGALVEKKNASGDTVVGVVRSTFLVSKGGTVKRAYPQVKAEGHAEEVLAEASTMQWSRCCAK